jgi:hypothetical protein
MMIRVPRILAVTIPVLALTLGTAVAVTASQPGPAYLAVQSHSERATSSNSARLSATMTGAIPRRPDAFIVSQAIVGVAWPDLDTGTALVATIHPAIGRDSRQRPDAWHVHTVQLTGGATAPNDFCLVEVASTPTAGIQIAGSTMVVNVRTSELPVAVGAIDAAVGFTVHPGDAGCGTGLGVRIRT